MVIGLAISIPLLTASTASAAIGGSSVSFQSTGPDLRTVTLTTGYGCQTHSCFEVENQVAVTEVTLPGQDPDLVIGDQGPGIADPIPPSCARVDSEIIRCPATAGVRFRFRIAVGLGSDSVAIDDAINPLSSASIFIGLGPGPDQALDSSRFHDLIRGAGGPDRIVAGPGGDAVRGGPGSDRLRGGAGPDFLLGGAQNDFVFGGRGRDTINCGPGPGDLGVGGPARDLGKNCETVRH